jgi:hypothetical protein
MNNDVNIEGGIGLLTILWICGLVVAKGFWQTLIAFVLFPYSWYLAVQYFMELI